MEEIMLQKMYAFTSFVVITTGSILHCFSQEPENNFVDKTLAPYFCIENEGKTSVETFPLSSTGVVAVVNGTIAEVTITQTYKNYGPVPVNGNYNFPMSTKAAVHGMTMRIGDNVITAKIKEKNIAKSEFEKAKDDGKSATLLEQQRPNVFTMNVSNIMPGDLVLVELKYTEFLTPEAGTYEFVFPTVVGPRYSNQSESAGNESDNWVKSPYLHENTLSPAAFSFKAIISTGIPIEEVSCTSHKVLLSWDSDSRVNIDLDKSEANGSNRDLILHYRLRGKEIQSGLLLYEDNNEKFFQITVQPPQRVASGTVLPREFVFIVDVSGSMNGFPLSVSKQLLRDLITHLKPEDLINVVLFAGISDILSEHSLPATTENLNKAITLIDQADGRGGTELVAGLEMAYMLPANRGYSRNLVVVTDGFISAEREVFSLVRKKLDEANVFAFGIGSSVNRYLIEDLAKAGFGEPFIVTDSNQALQVASRFREYVTSPLLTDIKVTGEGVTVYDVEPQDVPDLLADRPIVIFGKYQGTAHGTFAVTGVSAKGNYRKEFSLDNVAPSVFNSALRYLWARTKITNVKDYAAESDFEENVREITRLGLAYNLLTQYTSFIAVLEEVRNSGGAAQDVSQPIPLPQGVSGMAVGGGNKVPEPGLLEIVIGTVCGIAIVVFFRNRRLLYRTYVNR
jgi:Ca-activated chloride channel family protein